MNHQNHFNLIRLLLASAVIIGHCLMLKYPDFSADPVHLFGGYLDLHSLAVDFFFILSGYLITASWCSNPSLRRFGEKRLRRIYPGFIACFLVCVFVVAPIATHEPLPVLPNLRHVLVLSAPISTAFDGLLNPPMWTIQFEFGCYAMVACLGLTRCLNRWIVFGLLVVFIGLSFTHPSIWYADKAVRLAPFFLAGMCAWLWQPARNDWWMAICAGLVLCAFSSTWGIRLILPVAGAYLLCSLAFSSSKILTAFRPSNDISYGVYLYGWPVQKLILMYWPDVSLAVHVATSLAGAAVLAFASWRLIEEPFMRRKNKASIAMPVCTFQP